MKLPYLAGVVTANDVRQKGSGSYAADFVSWAKIMQLINEKAPGWMPQLGMSPEGGHVFKAPNDTGYLQVCFVHSEEGETMEWPQAIMDNRNNPIAYEKITARDVTDTHRRAICSAAAAFFSLGYELWAREEYAAAADLGEPPEPVSKPAAASKPKPAAQKLPESPSGHPDVRSDLESELIELLQTKMEKGATLKYLDQKATEWKLQKGGSRVQQMNVDQLQICIDELRLKKPA
tara:strand:+ start:1028 stop:1729 length:702 start_codon:yes stop_codon:yes gene_type:complete